MHSTMQTPAKSRFGTAGLAAMSVAVIALTMLSVGAAYAQPAVPHQVPNVPGNAAVPVVLPMLPKGLSDLGRLRPPEPMSAADREKLDRANHLPQGLGNLGRLRTAFGARAGVADTPVPLTRPKGLVPSATWVPRIPNSAAAPASVPRGTGNTR